MNENKYKIVFEGALLPEQSIELVMPRIAGLLKTDKEFAGQLFDGDKWLIKKNLTHNKALQYKTAFERSGAICKIESYSPGQSEQNQESDILNLDYFSFKPYPFSPGVFSMPKSKAVKNKENRPIFYISSGIPIIGRVFAFIIAALIAFFAQRYMTFFLAERFGTGTNTTILSIIIYFVTIIILYIMLTQFKYLHFFFNKAECHIFAKIKSVNSINFRYKSYNLTDKNNVLIGKIKKDLYHQAFMVNDNNGSLIYTAEESIDINDVGMDAASDLMDSVIDSNIWDILKSFTAFRKRFMGEGEDSTDKRIFIINNPGKKTIAKCKLGKRCELDIEDVSGVNFDKRILLALCLLISTY